MAPAVYSEMKWYACVLTDRQGLGKTLQIISHITKLKEDGLDGPCLIVAPLGVILNW
jgi:SNF2 family DNA or RNA helicase